MTQVAIISEDVATVDATASEGRMLLDPGTLQAAVGWELKPEGLCQGDVCVPVRVGADLFVGEHLDLARVAAALSRPIVVDTAAGVAAMALDPVARRQALALDAPPFTLDDLDGVPHSLSEWHGRKKLLFAFATW